MYTKKIPLPRYERRTFPKQPPYASCGDYLVSKAFSKNTPQIYECGDNIGRDMFIRRAFARQHLLCTEVRLGESKIIAHKKRAELDQQWLELRKNEEQLRETFIYFNKFVKENAEKIDRSKSKIREQKALTNQRQHQIEQLQKECNELLDVKLGMEKQITKYRIYETFLGSVVESQPYLDMQTITDVLKRYESLVAAKQAIHQTQYGLLERLAQAHTLLMKLVEEKNFIIMGLNNQIANLQARYENANVKSLECEQLVVQIKNSAVKQMNEIDEVKCSLWNVYVHMAQSKKHPIKIKKEAVEEQMMYIKRTLTELAKVNQILKKKSRAAAKAKEIAAKAAASNPY